VFEPLIWKRPRVVPIQMLLSPAQASAVTFCRGPITGKSRGSNREPLQRLKPKSNPATQSVPSLLSQAERMRLDGRPSLVVNVRTRLSVIRERPSAVQAHIDPSCAATRQNTDELASPSFFSYSRVNPSGLMRTTPPPSEPTQRLPLPSSTRA